MELITVVKTIIQIVNTIILMQIWQNKFSVKVNVVQNIII